MMGMGGMGDGCVLGRCRWETDLQVGMDVEISEGGWWVDVAINRNYHCFVFNQSKHAIAFMDTELEEASISPENIGLLKIPNF